MRDGEPAGVPLRAAGRARPEDRPPLHPGSLHAGRRLSREQHRRSTASASLATLGFEGLERLIRATTAAHAPRREVEIEPRLLAPIVYSEARARRLALPDDVCVVCDAQTCPAVDEIPLGGDDVAWLTPNLYPIVFPFEDGRAGAAAGTSLGLHLVQWSSCYHDRGWPGADEETARALLRQLAAAEELLLHGAGPEYADSGNGHRGHVSVIKNRGRRVGGSVEHDHQQILLSTVVPAETRASRTLAPGLRAAPPELVVERLGAATIVVPPFLRRPLQCFVLPEAGPVGWLHHLPEVARDALALAVARLTAATTALLREHGDEPAWNLLWHTGGESPPLLEMRPFSQPIGGYEHLGLWLCEESPAASAVRLREALGRL